MSINALMSAAPAPPRLTMKLACLDEISAPLSRLPFRPTFSTRRPATSPGGFFQTQPAVEPQPRPDEHGPRRRLEDAVAEGAGARLELPQDPVGVEEVDGGDEVA